MCRPITWPQCTRARAHTREIGNLRRTAVLDNIVVIDAMKTILQTQAYESIVFASI